MRPPVLSKSDMYRRLAAGEFGNTINQYFSINEWKDSEEYRRYEIWGVRTLTPGGPCRLFCPKDEVEETARSFAPHAFNISLMIDAVSEVKLMAEVFIGSVGLEVYGIENPPRGCNWRRDMSTLGKSYQLTAARGVLGRCLTPADRDDLYELLELYPNHVIEFSATNLYIGTLPNRSMIIWEVRIGDGSYERESWKLDEVRLQFDRSDGGA